MVMTYDCEVFLYALILCVAGGWKISCDCHVCGVCRVSSNPGSATNEGMRRCVRACYGCVTKMWLCACVQQWAVYVMDIHVHVYVVMHWLFMHIVIGRTVFPFWNEH